MMSRSESTSLFSKNFVVISLVNFLIMTVYYLLFVISSPYAIGRFHASPSVAGLVAGLMVLGCLVGRFLIGGFIYSLGFGRSLYIGCVSFSLSMGLYLWADTLPLLIFARFLSGICVGCVTTATGTIIAHITPPWQRGQAISYFSLSSVIAMAIGPFLGIFLLGRVTFAVIFWACLVCGLASFVSTQLLSLKREEMREQDVHEHAIPHPDAHSGLQRYIEFKAFPVAIPALTAGMCYGCVQAFMSYYAKELDLADTASVFFLAYAAAAFVCRPMAGRMFDTKGENCVVYPALFVMACSLFLLGMADNSLVFLLSGILLGVGFGTFQSTAQAIATKVAPSHRLGQATSTFYILLDLGIGFGPYLLGLAVPVAGYRGIYLGESVIALFTLFLYYLLHGRKQRFSA